MEQTTGEERAPQAVGELGERVVLGRILARLSAARTATVGPGDDCAVLSTPTGSETVITTDTMIEGPDLRLAWHDGFSLGWKLMATNLSDVAAMGAQPTAVTLALAVPAHTETNLLEDIAIGADAACAALAPGCGVVGGDLGTSPVLMAAVTALGIVPIGQSVLRSGARAGDVVAYCGDLGLAGLGLSLLFREAATPAGVAESAEVGRLWSEHAELMAAQLAPTPPIPLGVAAREHGATAMMDVSDGLALDAHRLARASDARVALNSDLLLGAFGEQHGYRVSVDAMLFGGEDHGLLATFPAGHALPAGFHRIGSVEANAQDQADAAHSLTLDGAPVEVKGWDPYAGFTLPERA